ncbi:MtrAB system accessory lipoprotein LpqB [Corynebacterium marinum]|uniref:Lipoprotein LpqB n=1 Tax=Corynebacterium marinum DSM 44953 TaxID=1224162 RepID=A0A0B6TRG3_9CORY|nr:MtrAB system accessory lipoprotein LpqB [Corynebacterium marinum]AJK68175.1 Lipoprotein LpqB [Corynebacterium marinum DSM 44953]GGO10406.1 lipoprotein LpqB [Corynebacterium marinum]
MRIALTLTAVAAAVGLLTACTTLPTDTEPQALRSFEPQVVEQTDLGPQPGQEPDLLLRDFYTASAHPVQDYQSARSFLTTETEEQWNPSESILVVDRIDLITQPGSTSERRSFNVRGSVVGRIATGGSYEPENGVYEATVEMVRENGQWRISALPAGVVLERTELRNQFQPQRLFFAAPSGNVLISDRRWIYSGHQALDTALITLMMEGPSPTLAPAVNDLLPPEATFAGVVDGAYNFTGLADADDEARRLFAAQLVWTLAVANVPEPYAVLADGVPLSAEYEQLTTDDFAEFNPLVNTSRTVPLYALTDGVVSRVASNQVAPVDGELGSLRDIESVDITSTGSVAAVRKEGTGPDSSVLMSGTLEEGLREALRAETMSRPTFEVDPQNQWVVVDGETVVRVVYSGPSGEFTRSEVDSSEIDGLEGDISVLRLSRSGARVAMIIDGRVHVGVVNRVGPADKRIVNVRELAPQLGGTALSLDWQPDGSLIVGTSTPETPVWRIEQDGSAVTSLPSGNITAPVVAVAAAPSMIYLTDANAVLQLPTTGGDNVFWREVSGLQGVRSAPVVAY